MPEAFISSTTSPGPGRRVGESHEFQVAFPGKHNTLHGFLRPFCVGPAV